MNTALADQAIEEHAKVEDWHPCPEGVEQCCAGVDPVYKEGPATVSTVRCPECGHSHGAWDRGNARFRMWNAEFVYSARRRNEHPLVGGEIWYGREGRTKYTCVVDSYRDPLECFPPRCYFIGVVEEPKTLEFREGVVAWRARHRKLRNAIAKLLRDTPKPDRKSMYFDTLYGIKDGNNCFILSF